MTPPPASPPSPRGEVDDLGQYLAAESASLLVLVDEQFPQEIGPAGVPEGVNSDVGGITVFGHRRDWGRDAGRPDAPAVRIRVLGFAGTIDVWRVPHDMHGSSYDDIIHRLDERPRRLPG